MKIDRFMYTWKHSCIRTIKYLEQIFTIVSHITAGIGKFYAIALPSLAPVINEICCNADCLWLYVSN